ncbi:MAG TPA: VOC family protein [Pirellulales bacterium]|nr:VOC family protein [Pirellulales bacterium]
MITTRRFSPRATCLILILGALLLTGVAGWAADDSSDAGSNFARTTIDVGVVVSDAKKAADFYTKALGFTEIEGFDVPAALGKDSGLIDGRPVHIRVLVLGEGETATKLKLLEFPDVKSKPVDNAFIHSTLGPSYLTIYVKDTTAALERAKKHGIKPRAKGPVELPKGFPQGVYLTVVNDPDGNFIELVGPKK